jgi:hypothetical protein
MTSTPDEEAALIAEVEEVIAVAWLRREDQRHSEHLEAIEVDPDYPEAVLLGDLADTADNFSGAARRRGFSEETIERVVRFWSHSVD